MKRPVVCYKTIQPIIYNKGTKYEKQCDTFLAYYHFNKETAQIECNKLNAEKPAQLWNGAPIDWTKIDRFFVDEQEKMED